MFQSTHPHGVRRFDVEGKSLKDCFNPRTHTGCDGRKGVAFPCCWLVSIHAPTRGATKFKTRICVYMLFQSTHPHGVRHAVAKLVQYDSTFQSTHPHGVRHTVEQEFSIMNGFQSTHPHGVRLDSTRYVLNLDHVSIHAPTRGATVIKNNLSSFYKFQSTHPHGVRLSIEITEFLNMEGFNPRTHTGCDSLITQSFPPICEFQSTHPHGVRQLLTSIVPAYFRFNPRTHTGCDGVLQFIKTK